MEFHSRFPKTFYSIICFDDIRLMPQYWILLRIPSEWMPVCLEEEWQHLRIHYYRHDVRLYAKLKRNLCSKSVFRGGGSMTVMAHPLLRWLAVGSTSPDAVLEDFYRLRNEWRRPQRWRCCSAAAYRPDRLRKKTLDLPSNKICNNLGVSVKALPPNCHQSPHGRVECKQRCSGCFSK